MIISSNATAVKVLKASGMPNLRIFPGPNTIEKEGLDLYFKDNAAAKAMRKKYFTVVNEESLSNDEKKIADAAKEKNDALNKFKKINKMNTEKLAENDTTIKQQAEQLKKQDDLLKEQGKQIKDLMKKMNDLTKPKK